MRYTNENQAAVRRYAELCDGGDLPDVVDYLRQCSELPADAQLEILLIDQHYRWKHHRAVDVQTYLDLCPLVAQEQRLRKQLLEEELGYLEDAGRLDEGRAFIERFTEIKRGESFGDDSDSADASQVSTQVRAPKGQSPDTDSSSVGETSLGTGSYLEGRYRLDDKLGEGTFGVVYLGHDDQLKRQVAIKLPRFRDPRQVAAFLEEARNVARLDHPGIIPVYDAGKSADGLCYVISRYIEGENLATRMQREPLDRATVCRWVGSVAESLHYAHRHGLVHRDIKPANILIDAHGYTFLTDFGLALKDEDFGRGATFAGTPAYMSPEQARGEGHRVDARSDVYSLGVIFYELLTGKRPYHRAIETDVLEQVRIAEAHPPRQVDDTIPRELERICLKALAKRVSERYTTAIDLADDLRSFLESDAGRVLDATPSAASELPRGAAAFSGDTVERDGSDGGPPIVPKGMRSFGHEDQEFFLQLVPGPRDRTGVPESIRFWQSRIEEMDADKTFPVGLIYGPSGCGKSSLVKAGVLPRLSRKVRSIYVEATGDSTENRIINALRKQLSGLPEGLSLAEYLSRIRRDRTVMPSGKMLLVIDQFEQWLHTWNTVSGTPLVQALRQCDGERLQCLVLVRDDFWMAATRFMMELEIRLVEGLNSAAVDLFDLRHARKVLTAYGRAFGALPQKDRDQTRSHQAFVEQAIDELAQDDKVIPVRLALFAEMVKRRPWIPQTLRELGGSQGVGVVFLEEAFGATAAPLRRYYGDAVRAVLSCLLPEKGADIRGNMRSREELMTACGLQNRPQNFDDVVHILDTELRLITPADPESSDGPNSTGGTDGPPQYFQLTHDYLVRSVRNWLTSKQRRTRRGRAALRLEELATDWRDKPENRNLPSFWEFLSIQVLTKESDRGATQRVLLRKAARYYAIRVAAMAAMVILSLYLGRIWWQRASAREGVEQLLVARTADAPRIIDQMQGERRWAVPILRDAAALLGRPLNSREELNVSLALLPDDAHQVDYLTRRIVTADVADISVIVSALRPFSSRVRSQLWQNLIEADGAATVLPTAAALAAFDPQSEHWTEVTGRVANALVETNALNLGEWIDVLSPVGSLLIHPLIDIYVDHLREDAGERSLARDALQALAGQNTPLIVRALVDCVDKDFNELLQLIEGQKQEAIPLLMTEMNRTPPIAHPAISLDLPAPPPGVVVILESAGGQIRADSAFCHALTLEGFQSVVSPLSESKYRPICMRPYLHRDGGIRVAVVWTRDDRSFRWAVDQTIEDLQRLDQRYHAQGLSPIDVGGYLRGGPRFCAIWAEPASQGSRGELYAGLPSTDPRAQFDAWIEHGLRPTRRQMFVDQTGDLRHCMIWSSGAYDTEESYHWQGNPSGMTRMFAVQPFPIDVSATVWRPSDADPDQIRLTGIWRRSGKNLEAAMVQARSVDEHDQRSRELAEQAFRPVSLARVDVPQDASDTLILSVWHRPVMPAEEHDAYLLRRAKAAAALFRLGQAHSVMPLLTSSPQPDLRHLLIATLARTECPPAMLVSQLKVTLDPSVRQSILLCLSEYDQSDIPADVLQDITPLLVQWYSSDPDVGVHSGIDCCMRRWGMSDRLELPRDVSDAGLVENRQWWQPSRDECFALIDATSTDVPFLMGCPVSEVEYGWYERLHLKHLMRRFAISTTEVRVQQFREFLAANPDVDYPFTEDETAWSPATRVTWYLAAHYCNWRSELEGIPPDQWCFQPTEDGRYAEGMRLAPDYLKRTGYRLPTETEWEYVCRAGTQSVRFFGRTSRLLSRYAWYSENAQQTQPVATLKPNPWGMFDLLGNAREWCMERYVSKLEGDSRILKEDYEDELLVDSSEMRATRGGSFASRRDYLRSADKVGYHPGIRHDAIGFRLARTLVDRRDDRVTSPSNEP